MKTVLILGTGHNLGALPRPIPAGVEVWMSNAPRGYETYIDRPTVRSMWTRWFNLHSRAHMDATYPEAVAIYQAQSGEKPIYTQLYQPDFPGCVPFPREPIQQAFALEGGPNRYFTCSIGWLLAFALYEGFDRVELWGFALSDRKPNNAYLFERPCFWFWVKRLQDAGVTVTWQHEISQLPFEPGNPEGYTGPLYGYDTKPEVGWDSVTQSFL